VTDDTPSVTDDTQVAMTLASTAVPLINDTEVEPAVHTIRTPTVIVEPESD
jgi:hypothetical protein